MAVVSFSMKTISRTDLTGQFDNLSPCVVHGKTPRIFHTVAGRKKHDFYIALCEHDDCSKMGYNAADAVAAWNKWNPPANKNPASNE